VIDECSIVSISAKIPLKFSGDITAFKNCIPTHVEVWNLMLELPLLSMLLT
jgi:hypothetical protein